MRRYFSANQALKHDSRPRFKIWMCLICGYIYDEAPGIPDDGIAPGIRWEGISIDWTCPECHARKEDFEMVEVQLVVENQFPNNRVQATFMRPWRGSAI